jgi:urease accessory protein
VVTFGPGHGQLAARQTGPGLVHLVATAAGPLGGDHVEVCLRIGAGASLMVRSAAATLALPGRSGEPSVVDLVATVEDGGMLDLALEPCVVAAGAELHSTVSFRLAGTAAVFHRERVALGRWGEPAGTWRGSCRADRDDVPLLRHALAAGPGAPGWLPPHAHRAMLTELRLSGRTPDRAATQGGAVALPLSAGGLLLTAVASDLGAARRDAEGALAQLDPFGHLEARPPASPVPVGASGW